MIMLRRAVPVALVALALLGAGATPSSARADTGSITLIPLPGGWGVPVQGPSSGVALGSYLALGDSVPFGYSPLLPLGSPPSAYVGYPQVTAKAMGLALTNLSCPGQTTGGFSSLTATDNGCLPFRAAASLHTSYSGTQLAAALAFLRSHPDTTVVTVMLGANDLLLCADGTPDGCTSPSEITAVLSSVGADYRSLLTALRAVYKGQIILVNYYATDYSDLARVQAIQALNAVIAGEAAAAAAKVADAYTAFQQASSVFQGNPCAAGFLIALPTGGCDIHPSRLGAQLLASTVLLASVT